MPPRDPSANATGRPRGRLDPLAIGGRGRGAPLQPLQRWFQSQLTGAGDARLAIYREMYRLRLERALAADYPNVRQVLGAERFGALCGCYLAAHPSTSFTLERIDSAFSDFISSWEGLAPDERPAAVEAVFVDRLGKELAERDESPTLDPSEAARLDPNSWDRAVLVPIAALRLVRTAHGRRQRGLVIWRQGGAVRRMALSLPAWRLLADLVGGLPLASAIERVTPGARVAIHVGRWFRRWTSAGLFTRVDFV